MPVADPGFPVGACAPPMQVLCAKNVCKNERIGAGHAPPRSANAYNFSLDVDNKDLCISFNKLFRISKMIQINNYLTVATEVNNKKQISFTNIA